MPNQKYSQKATPVKEYKPAKAPQPVSAKPMPKQRNPRPGKYA